MFIQNLILIALLQTDPLPVQIHKMLRAGDAYNAALVMQSYGDPRTISNLYIEVSDHIYWNAGDLPSSLVITQQGIDFSISSAREVQSTNRTLADALHQIAGKLAYNLASFTWPGWGEASIQISPADLAKGFAAAELAVQLAAEPNRAPQDVFDANWVLGAHELARGRHAEAIAAFEKSHQIATAASLQGSALLARGYAGLAKVAGKSAAAQGEQEFKQAKDALAAQRVEDAETLVSQLDTAYRVFVK